MKTAVVTGCTKGIGAAISKKLLSNKCSVIGCYSNDVENANLFSSELGENTNLCSLIKADLSTWDLN